MHSFILAARLTSAELAMLGNNLLPAARRSRTELGAVNRSLLPHGESVPRLYGKKTHGVVTEARRLGVAGVIDG